MRLLLTAVVSMSLLFGCGEGSLFGIIDTNGENYDNERILKKTTSRYSYWEKEGEVDSKNADIHFYLSGNDVIWKIEAEENVVLNCEYDIDISEGKFKIIEITTDDDIRVLWENAKKNKEKGAFPIELGKGTQRIKIVGQKAKGNVKLSLQKQSKVEVEAMSYTNE